MHIHRIALHMGWCCCCAQLAAIAKHAHDTTLLVAYRGRLSSSVLNATLTPELQVLNYAKPLVLTCNVLGVASCVVGVSTTGQGVVAPPCDMCLYGGGQGGVVLAEGTAQRLHAQTAATYQSPRRGLGEAPMLSCTTRHACIARMALPQPVHH